MTNIDDQYDDANEFLETNLLSCYSSSSVRGYHTRKYHGLFVASQQGQRFVLLSQLDINLKYQNQDYSISHFCHDAKQMANSRHPLLSKYQLVPWPLFEYTINNHVGIRIEFLLSDSHPGLWVCLQLIGNLKDVKIEIKPLFAFRNSHELSRKNDYVNQKIDILETKSLRVKPYEGLDSLYMQCSKDYQFKQAFSWHENHYYFQEAQRGYPANEDLFSYGHFKARLSSEKTLIFLFSTAEFEASLIDSLALIKKYKKNDYQIKMKKDNGLLNWSSKHFLIQTQDTYNMIAGFPWFSCWGRDSLISLPGLLLVTKRYDEARQLLKAYALEMKMGCIPNTLNTNGKAESYNSVDATFWFVWAVSQFWEHTQDEAFIVSYLWSALDAIYEHIMNDSHPLIVCDQDGMLSAGSKDTQLTWMDAKTDKGPVTPREGYPIEINALWFHMLSFMNLFSPRINKQYPQLPDLLAKVKENFSRFYWLEQEQYFADFYSIKNNQRSYSLQLRPNQCVALALLPLPKKQAQLALKNVYQHLWTPYGLRTLSPQDPMFKGVYQGDQNNRDQAYHNGIVWPWLLGFYTEAVCRYQTLKKHTAQKALKNLQQFAQNHAGLLPEIFDAQSPYKARGCIHQAWSVAEILRSEYLLKL